MSQPETRLQVRIERELRDRGIFVRRQRLFGRIGWPDLYLIFPCCGRAGHLEVKMPGETPEKIQLATLRELCDAGAETSIATCLEDALQFVDLHQCRRTA